MNRRWTPSRLLILWLMLVSVVLVVWLGFTVWDRHRRFEITLAAGSRAGESFVLSKALESVVERHFPRIHMEVVESGGTAESRAMLETGRANLATAQADVAEGASVRMVAILYEDRFQLFARNGSGIRSIPDLKGRRIALPPSGGQYQSFLAIASHFDLQEPDFEFIGASDEEAAREFIAGRADALFRVRAPINASLSQIAHSRAGYLVEIDQGPAMELKFPAFTPVVIPKGAYLGNPPLPDRDMATVAVRRTLVAHRDADPWVVNAITSVLMERRQELAKAVAAEQPDLLPLVAGIAQPPESQGLSAPLHPGAASFYNRDKPTFLKENADYLALLLTIAVLVGSWIWQGTRWVEARQKNRADQYTKSVVKLMQRAESSKTEAELNELRSQLLALLAEAVRALDEDRITEDSFQSFRVVWQISLDVIRERRLGLAHG